MEKTNTIDNFRALANHKLGNEAPTESVPYEVALNHLRALNQSKADPGQGFFRTAGVQQLIQLGLQHPGELGLAHLAELRIVTRCQRYERTLSKLKKSDKEEDGWACRMIRYHRSTSHDIGSYSVGFQHAILGRKEVREGLALQSEAKEFLNEHSTWLKPEERELIEKVANDFKRTEFPKWVVFVGIILLCTAAFVALMGTGAIPISTISSLG